MADGHGESFEMRLQAIGRILDRRAPSAKEVCVLQTGDGFVVNLLAPTMAHSGPAYAPTTIVIEGGELKGTIDELTATPAAPKKSSGGWWGRG